MPNPLPKFILFSDFKQWEPYLDWLYKYYLDEIVNAELTFQGSPIRYRFIPMTDGKGFGFWHLISEGEDEEKRLPSLERCERLRWIKWMIQESDSNPDILFYESRRGSSTNLILWNQTIHYVVILGKRNGYYLLVSAYPVSGSRERTFKKEWLAYHGKG